MLRSVISACRTLRPIPYFVRVNAGKLISNEYNNLCTPNLKKLSVSHYGNVGVQPLINNKQILDISKSITLTPVRTVTKFSLKSGKRKSVKVVLKKFFRLHWGGWIRTRAGRNKRRWRKTLANQRRARQHVFCNATQNTLLDKMVTKFWKKPKYYVDDPYAPYHTREEFHLTRRKPRVTY